MVEFAEAIGFVFDHMYPEAPLTTLEPETKAQFDAFFDDIMDGRFLREYTVSEGKSFPRKTKCIEERLHRIDDEDGFDLEELATEMTSCGLEEARVYTIIMDAIEMGNLALTSIGDVRPDVTPPPVKEPDALEAESEPEVSESPPEKVVKIEVPEPDVSEDEKFDEAPPLAEEPEMAESEPEVSEPPSEVDVKKEEPAPEKSEEDMFLEDVESLLSKENEEEKEE